MADKKTQVHKTDGWQNVITGQGVTTKDKTKNNTPYVLTFSEAEAETT